MKNCASIRGLCRLGLVAAGAALLGACARFHERPLGSAVPPPSLAHLEVAAQHIDAPLLPPVHLAPGPLTPDQIALLAVAGNPGLRAARDRLGVARAQVVVAGLLPNPTLGLGYSMPLGNTTGLSQGYNVGLGIDLTALLGRSLRRQGAQAAEHAVALKIAWQEWQVAEQAKLDALQLQALDRALRAAHAWARHASRQARRMQQALTTHDVSLVDADAARAAASQTRLAWLRLGMQADHMRAQLDALLGLAPGTRVPLAARNGPDPWNDVPAVPDLLQHLEHRRLDLLALRAGYRSANARLRQAILGQFPDIALTVTRARDTTDVNTLNPGVSVTLPLFNHNQGAIALARASRRQLFDAYQARVFEAGSDVARLRRDLIWTSRRIRLARSDRHVQRALVVAARRAFQGGEIDAVSLYTAESRAAASALEVLRLERRRNVIGVALEVASGRYFEALPRRQGKPGGSPG